MWKAISDKSASASNHVPGLSKSGFQAIILIVLIVGPGIVIPGRASAQTFNDVPTDHWAYSFIETFAARGITAGCGNGDYCPDETVTRAQMAVFLERGMNSSDFSPPAATGAVYGDVDAGDFAANFIEQLAADGITAGCGSNNYCPGAKVTRDQMAVFLLRAKFGPSYSPPTAIGMFNDVPLGHWAAAWIEKLLAEGITAGCGGGNYCPESPVTRDQMAVFLVRTFNLFLIEDAPDKPIVDASTDIIVEGGIDPETVGAGAFGGEVYRTRLGVELTAAATVGEINTLLLSIDAKIVAMTQGEPLLVIAFPDPGSFAALESMVENLESNPIVVAVHLSGPRDISDIPTGVFSSPPSAADLLMLDHHVATRAYAAWNARVALQGKEPPTLLIYDSFGGSAPDSDLFDVITSPGDWMGFVPPAPCQLSDEYVRWSKHGYHVTGLATAKFGGSTVVGTLPTTAQLAVENMLKFLDPRFCDSANVIRKATDLITADTAFLQRIRDELKKNNNSKKVVVNISQGGSKACRSKTVNIEECYLKDAEIWHQAFQVAGLDTGRLLVVVSAGNEDGLSIDVSHDIALAVRQFGGLVVENRDYKTGIPANGCNLDVSSSKGGNISAPGSSVWSFTSEIGDTKYDTGTSQAAPQVAGIAAYIWALRPNLTSTQVAALIRSTANLMVEECGIARSGEPVLDAYRAVLSTDQPLIGPVIQAPVRKTILDVTTDGMNSTPDGRFDESDLTVFQSAFQNPTGEKNYSRHDLNGDGYTGGENTTNFNLNIDPGYLESESLQVNIEGVMVDFNESAVTDLQVLCYYAYSNLYGGTDTDARRNLMAARCGVQGFSIMGLGILPRGTSSSARAISADGSTVVGISRAEVFNGTIGNVPFRWTSSEGMVPLTETGVALQPGYAYAVSADGSVIVGWTRIECPIFSYGWCWEPFRWTSDTGIVRISQRIVDTPDTNWRSTAFGVSADGSVVVGLEDSGNFSSPRRREAFRWTSGGIQGLGFLPGRTASQALAVSADGSTIVGDNSGGEPTWEAIRWTAGGPPVGLGFLPGGTNSHAFAVSADGSVIVGRSQDIASSRTRAFRWTASDNRMVDLGILPGGNSSGARAVSADGTVVIGDADRNNEGHIFIWDAAAGMRSVSELLIANGITGWTILGPKGVSGDGRKIVGTGKRPGGTNFEAILITLPSDP